ncbi:MAG: hypothetical protein IT582_01720, partial [Opitutaceae bacterium]|nr:hypothetical protein [Opitutaceae bacterium]
MKTPTPGQYLQLDRFNLRSLLFGSVLLLATACGGAAEDGTKPIKPKSNVIAGRVTMEDGSPLRGDIQDVVISISGVSGAGEKVSYTPVVKPDGTYSQKVAHGMYSFSTNLFCYVVIMYGDIEFRLPLEHVGRNWNKRQDSEEGIVQDFVLKFTGPTPYGKSEGLNIGNATHWYGLSIGMSAGTYRNDINASAFKIPAGTKLTFTLKATGNGIDGRPIPGPITLERVYKDRYESLDLNDLMPAPYEVTGTATLPDGTTKRLLFQGPGDYPNYKPALSLPLQS